MRPNLYAKGEGNPARRPWQDEKVAIKTAKVRQ
jgi:hypothetical protein